MTKKHGYDIKVWDAVKEEIRRILISRARSTSPTIAYSELTAEMRTLVLQPDSFALRTMLGEVSTEEDALGRGMLTVLVVHKDGDLMPGAGFFDLADGLGRDVSDRDKAWVAEFTTVTNYWRSH